jgi:hypothetical protein
MHRMFEQLARTQDVRHMIAAQYGERLSAATLARYKRKHWQEQRELVQAMSEAIGGSGDLAIGSSGHRAIEKLSVVRGPLSVASDTRRSEALSH